MLMVTVEADDSGCEGARLGEGEGGLLMSETSDIDMRMRFAPCAGVEGAVLKPSVSVLAPKEPRSTGLTSLPLSRCRIRLEAYVCQV